MCLGLNPVSSMLQSVCLFMIVREAVVSRIRYINQAIQGVSIEKNERGQKKGEVRKGRKCHETKEYRRAKKLCSSVEDSWDIAIETLKIYRVVRYF